MVAEGGWEKAWVKEACCSALRYCFFSAGAVEPETHAGARAELSRRVICRHYGGGSGGNSSITR